MVSSNVPRPEYPRPQMVRDRWMNLNGEWQFEIDPGKSGRERKLPGKDQLHDRIIVPFCPESKLSGIEYKDFMNSVWYKREFELPRDWSGGRVLLHFGAVDYNTEVWVNGVSCGKHKGGYTSFHFDITDLLTEGRNILTVCAEDDVRSGLQPRGKQSGEYYSHGCDYTRTTGIWQTVWLENVPMTYISSCKMIPDPDNACVHITTAVNESDKRLALAVKALYKGRVVGESTCVITGRDASQTVALSEVHLWGPGCPELYDLEFELLHEGTVLDTVKSYFGLRTVSLDKNAILINHKKVFQRLVLDQGFYPEGIYTAPADEDLKRDIEISMGLGFNGARMHEKVFEPRYIYWADQLGYLVWGEHANWGLDISTASALEHFLPEWVEAVNRDFNHPSIVGWCPFNETWDGPDGRKQNNQVLSIVYTVTKELDKTRPVIDTSGNFHVVTDVFDIHDYEQDVEKFKAKFEPMKNGGEKYVTFPQRQRYEGQPYFVSEYGGIQWNYEVDDKFGWGYGNKPKTEEEFIERYRGLTTALLSNPYICAFCYTQLYDVEQEVNGLYTYSRTPKFNPEIFREINTQQAAIEK